MPWSFVWGVLSCLPVGSHVERRGGRGLVEWTRIRMSVRTSRQSYRYPGMVGGKPSEVFRNRWVKVESPLFSLRLIRAGLRREVATGMGSAW